MKIELNYYYKSRDEKLYYISRQVTGDSPGDYPFIGYHCDPQGVRLGCDLSWTETGIHMIGNTDLEDLVAGPFLRQLTDQQKIVQLEVQVIRLENLLMHTKALLKEWL